MTQKAGRRWSAADAYLHPAAGRPNLTIQTDALVTGVIIEDGRATGVRYLRRGVEEVARAEAEVILSGGAIGSPQLLMLSGVGPADHLLEHGIAVQADSPGVGGNLSDHPVVTGDVERPQVAEPVGEAGAAQPGPLAADAHRAADNQHRGGWRVLPLGPGAASARHTVARAARSLPERRSRRSRQPCALGADHAGVGRQPRARSGCAAPTRGTSRSIDPSYLSDLADLDPLVKGIGMAREIAAARPLQPPRQGRARAGLMASAATLTCGNGSAAT